MELIIATTLILISILSLSNSLLVHMGDSRPHCFEKALAHEDILLINYIVSSDKEEKLSMTLTKLYTEDVIFQLKNNQTSNFKSDLLKSGIYTLCFIPSDANNYFISFDFISYSEAGVVKELAQDKEVKLIGLGIDQIKTAFQDFELKLKNIVDRRSRHNIILNDIIKSIKKLTFVKIAIITLISIFQVFLIRKFFGPDKRVTKVSGPYSHESL